MDKDYKLPQIDLKIRIKTIVGERKIWKNTCFNDLLQSTGQLWNNIYECILNLKMKQKMYFESEYLSHDLPLSISHKDHCISLLQNQIHQSGDLRNQYARGLNHRENLQQKYKKQSKENVCVELIQDYLKEEFNEEMENMNKTCEDVKGFIRSLEKQAKEKNVKLKSLKIQTQNQINYNEQYLEEIQHKEEVMQDLHNEAQLLQTQKERLKNQILIFKEQSKKSKYAHNNILKQIDEVKNSILSLKPYVRDQKEEEIKINKCLQTLEDENNSIDLTNDNFDCLMEELCRGNRVQREKCEKLLVSLKKKEIEKGRLIKEFNEVIKKLRKQDQKERNLKGSIERTLTEIKKVTELRKNAEDVWKQESTENRDIQRINSRLKKDLELCQKHLSNLMKNKKGVEENLIQYQQTNKIVIKKLQRVSTSKNLGKQNVSLYETTDEFPLKF